MADTLVCLWDFFSFLLSKVILISQYNIHIKFIFHCNKKIQQDNYFCKKMYTVYLKICECFTFFFNVLFITLTILIYLNKKVHTHNFFFYIFRCNATLGTNIDFHLYEHESIIPQVVGLRSEC